MQQEDPLFATQRIAAGAAVAMANTLFAGYERLARRQSEATRQAIAALEDAAEQIKAASGFDELVSAHARVARTQFEQTATWWANVIAETGAAQKAFVHQWQACTLQVADGLSRAVAAAPGTAPVMHAMKLVADATRSSYAATASPRPATPADQAMVVSERKLPATAKGGSKQQAAG